MKLAQRQMPGREEEKKTKLNKSKAEPVSSWCYQRQAGSVKASQRVVWSLIFIVFGVRLVKVEEQEIQAQKMSEKDFYPIPRVDVRWKRMLSWEACNWKGDEREFFAKKKKKRETARVRTQGPLKKTARVGTQVPLKESARERKQGKEGRKGGNKRSVRKVHGRDSGVNLERFF